MNFAKRAWPAVRQFFRKSAAVVWRALVKYDETDGEQRAASFAYYAFFALFPLVVLLMSIGAMFVPRPTGADLQEVDVRITQQLQDRLPVDADTADRLIQTIRGVVRSRGQASVIAFFILAWSAVRFFQALVRGVNRAWGTKEYSWWRLPIKNLAMVAILASALLLGIVAPFTLDQVEYIYWRYSWQFGLDYKPISNVFSLLRGLLPPLVLFYGFLMFYKFAPRRRTSFREVWIAAVVVTIGLDLLQRMFVLYTQNIANFNALYGTFGSIVALLMWIYLSGSLIILGGCLSAAQYEIARQLTDQSEPEHPR